MLFDKEYVNLVKETIIKITCQYAVPVYNLDNIDQIPKDEIHFTINDQHFLDTLLMEIRGKSISYSVYKKKKYTELEQNICDEIKSLEESDILDWDKIERKKHELLELRKEKLKGHYIKSRSKWIEEGEKPTKHFCNLESRNYFSKLITRIQLENGTEVNDQKEILKETKTFDQKLYSAPSLQNDDDIIKKISHCNFNKLTDSEAEELEGEIKYTEVLTFLKTGKEMFYLTTHSTHFIYGYVASDIW